MKLRLVAVALSLAAVAAGCAPNEPADQDTSGPTPTPTPTNSASTPSDIDTESTFTLDDHLTWLINVLDTGAFEPAEATERFDPDFLGEVPVAALNAPLTQIAGPASAPWQVIDDHRDGPVAEIIVGSATGTRLLLTFAITNEPPHRIEGLALQPAPVATADGYTSAQLDADLDAFARHAAVGIYDATSGACDIVHEHNADDLLAIGSIFKLWVLAELAHQIDQGTAAWDEPLEIRPELRSNPAPGIFQLSDGDTRTLRELAEAMISISDNTATDHLIDRLGRTNIEAAIARAGVTHPEHNQPLLATRELFWIKYLAQPPNPPDWYAADTDTRRALLADLAGQTVPWVTDPTLTTAPNAEGIPQDQPRNLDIEYHATARDLCATWLHLHQLGTTTGLEPITEITTINPGIDLATDTWTDIAFKGGNEPGVLALTWRLHRHDGRSYVITGILNDPDKPLDLLAGTQLIISAIALI